MTIDRRDDIDADAKLKALFDEWDPDVIVVGVPYNMDGSDAAITAIAIAFGDELANRFALPVERVDERLTSVEAAGILKAQRQSGQRRKKVRPGDIDSLAAQLIADSWLRQA
jgi:putative Holliday junction resolvase